MFKKIVSHLPFSPAIIGQLAFYARRLRKEEVTRRLGLAFVILALMAQSLSVFQPAESANASSATDMVTGGITSLKNYLSAYDSNVKHLQDTMDYIGITRKEIASAEYTSWTVGDKYSWGYASRFSYAQGERAFSVTNSEGKTVTTVYVRPLKLWSSSKDVVYGWTGYSKAVGWFGILKSCGNLVTKIIPKPQAPKKCKVNSSLLASDPDCKTCPGDETLWLSDPKCTPNIVKTKTALNISQGNVDASTVTAKAGDRISYTITIENTGLNSTSVEIKDSLSDVLEYATLVDSGGGTLDYGTKILSWPNVTLNSGEKKVETFVVKISDPIPTTAQGQSDPTSYDCVVSNTFGTAVSIKVDCPVSKVVETTATQLPTTGPTENMIFAYILLAVTVYFYARVRQMKTEVRLIRRDTTTGAL